MVVDVKHELSWDGYKVTSSIDEALNGPNKHVIFRPDSTGYVNPLLWGLYHQKGWDIFIDEVYGISNRGNATSYPPAYIALLTRGRSRGITVWSGMQRPRFAPLFAFTESTHFFVFRVAHSEDRKTIGQFTVPELKDYQPERYAFAYYNRIEHEVKYSKPLGESFR